MERKDRKDIVEYDSDSQEDIYTLPLEVQEKLEWFKDQKLGIIFHWGIYSVAGIVESWQLSEEDDWARKKGAWRSHLNQLRKDYWALPKQFNPINFNPDNWAEMSEKAGFKYMIFTTKHHDGFNMYDTSYSDYKITGDKSAFKTNPKADVFKEVAEAFRKRNLAVGAYYSKADWYSPYYWVPGQHAKGRTASYDPKECPEIWNGFRGFVHNQLEEIAKKYGPIDITWLDAGWVRKGRTNEDLDMDQIASKMRKYNPEMLIVDRSVGGEHENYVTPERKIPEIAPEKPWESNIPHAKNWGYVPDDVYKSSDDLIASLIKVVSMGGNLIIGVGPKPDGTLPETSIEMMKDLGDWTGTYGEGIYGTRPWKITRKDNWFFTCKKNVVYVFSVPQGDEVESTLELNMFPEDDVISVHDLEGNKLIDTTDGRIVNQSEKIKGYRIESKKK